MVGSRSWWAATVALMFLFACSGCKCDKKADPEPEGSKPSEPAFESTVSKLKGAELVDVARIIPAEVDLAVWAESPAKVQAWLAGREWWKGVVSSPVWEDLALSGPLYELSTARHKLASMSPVDFSQPNPKELLQGPIAIALTRDPEGDGLLVVKQIDLKVQALARLAEVFNQAHAEGALKSREFEGIELKSFELGPGRAVHYALFSNLLLVSNDSGLLEQAAALAAGKDSGSLVTAEGYKALFAAPTGADLGIFLRPAGMSRWLDLILPLDGVRIDWSLGPTPSAQVNGVVDGEPAQAPAAGTGLALAKLIPLDSRLAIAHSDLAIEELWGEIESGLAGDQAEEDESPAISKTVIPVLTGEAALVVTRLDVPVPEAALLLRAKPGALKKGALTTSLAKTLGLFFGSEPQAQAFEDLGGHELWIAEGGQVAPSFAFAGDWLVIGSSAATVRTVVSTHLGKAPALSDRAGFGDRIAKAAEPFFGLTYVDCEKLFSDMLGTTRNLMTHSERFDANDFDDTLAPLLEALKQVGRLGGGLGRIGESGQVKGQVVAL